jgi:hypothetical protein
MAALTMRVSAVGSAARPRADSRIAGPSTLRLFEWDGSLAMTAPLALQFLDGTFGWNEGSVAERRLGGQVQREDEDFERMLELYRQTGMANMEQGER